MLARLRERGAERARVRRDGRYAVQRGEIGVEHHALRADREDALRERDFGGSDGSSLGHDSR